MIESERHAALRGRRPGEQDQQSGEVAAAHEGGDPAVSEPGRISKHGRDPESPRMLHSGAGVLLSKGEGLTRDREPAFC